MVKTIETASHISVQGEFVRKLPDGRVVVRVGNTTFAGIPVGQPGHDAVMPNLVKVA